MTSDDRPEAPRRRASTAFSTSLLDEVMRDALEPGYADAARARGDEVTGRGGAHEVGRRPARRGLHVGLVLVLLLAGFVGALAFADVRRSAPDAAAARRQLADQVLAREQSTDALAGEVARLRATVSRARDERLAATRAGRARSQAIAQLELATGAVAVTGPGVRVTVDDAPPAPDGTGSDQPDLGTVQDRDIQLVVNGLWAAGAEAVSVGGYRVTARTAIRSAGEAILVDFRPIAAPYVIDAIGDPVRLRARFTEGPGGRALTTLNATYGIRFRTESVARMTLPAAVSVGEVAIGRTGGTP